jgi:hypothetical protein
VPTTPIGALANEGQSSSGGIDLSGYHQGQSLGEGKGRSDLRNDMIEEIAAAALAIAGQDLHPQGQSPPVPRGVKIEISTNIKVEIFHRQAEDPDPEESVFAASAEAPCLKKRRPEESGASGGASGGASAASGGASGAISGALSCVD